MQCFCCIFQGKSTGLLTTHGMGLDRWLWLLLTTSCINVSSSCKSIFLQLHSYISKCFWSSNHSLFTALCISYVHIHKPTVKNKTIIHQSLCSFETQWTHLFFVFVFCELLSTSKPPFTLLCTFVTKVEFFGWQCICVYLCLPNEVGKKEREKERMTERKRGWKKGWQKESESERKRETAEIMYRWDS